MSCDNQGKGDGRGLLIPKEVTDRALGEGSEEVEIFEEPGVWWSPPHGKPGN